MQQTTDSKMLSPLTIELRNSIREVSRLGAFVEKVCRSANTDTQTATSVRLAMEEAVVNIIKYAYPEGTKGRIHICANCLTDKLTFVISDNGKPFDPTAAEPPDTSLLVSKRPIGGLGIYLMRRCMDAVSYKRTDDCNILSLTKTITL